MSCQAQMMEVSQQKQKLEEALRQRERELTALKGALKDEVASHDKEVEGLREQYSTDMEKLRSSMEQVSQVCERLPLHLCSHQHLLLCRGNRNLHSNKPSV